MKFIAGLRVWVTGGTGKTPQVFPRFRGSKNRRVDLHLPLIASIPGRSRTGHQSRRTKRATHVSRVPERRWPLPLLGNAGIAPVHCARSWNKAVARSVAA